VGGGGPIGRESTAPGGGGGHGRTDVSCGPPTCPALESYRATLSNYASILLSNGIVAATLDQRCSARRHRLLLKLAHGPHEQQCDHRMMVRIQSRQIGQLMPKKAWHSQRPPTQGGESFDHRLTGQLWAHYTDSQPKRSINAKLYPRTPFISVVDCGLIANHKGQGQPCVVQPRVALPGLVRRSACVSCAQCHGRNSAQRCPQGAC
jgi:hypothetical protein